MKKILAVFAFAAVAAVAVAAVAVAFSSEEAPGPPLEAGATAPGWTLPGSDGNSHSLDDLLKEGAVVLAWFPKAFTPGCTVECKSLAENGDRIREFKASYFMASVDPIADNTAFAGKYGADFPILSDENKEVAKAYRVLGRFGMPKRETFYIGRDGVILAVDRKVNNDTAAEDIASTLERLGVEKRAASAPNAG